jgi:hypothetical protein
MSSTKSQNNLAIVDRWFTEFWGKSWNPGVVEELGAPDILLQYCCGRHAAAVRT